MFATKRPELLSPAGSMDSVKAAVNNGADAVYLGGRDFSARQYANNFDLEELEEVVDYCHLRGVKVYITVNIVYKDKEMKELLKFVSSLYKMGVDALIMQNIGAAMLIKENFGDVKLHASTQLTANSLDDVQALGKIGFSKIVLSRELNIKEIKDITKASDVEIETFIHGALCVSYSGQCIMSSMLGGRSGNRGRCAQTCRLPFSLYKEYDKINEGHLLCLKDLMTLNILPSLIDAGIASFKIEGRMKSPEYVAGTTKIYKKYIDMYLNTPEKYKIEESDIKALLQLFNRGGFTEGYYNAHSGRDMLCPERPKNWGLKTGFVDTYDKKHGIATIRTREALVPGDGIEVWTQKEPHVGTNINKASRAGEVISVAIKGDLNKNDAVYKTNDKALFDKLKRSYQKDARSQNINGELLMKIGMPLQLLVWDNLGNKATVFGETVEIAQNNPLNIDKVKAQVMKTGGTAFSFNELKIEADENVYIGISSINQLRRDALAELEGKIVDYYKHKDARISVNPVENNGQFNFEKKLNVHVHNFLQFQATVVNDRINIIYYEINNDFKENYEECIKLSKANGIKLYGALPRVYRGYTSKIYDSFINDLSKSKLDGFLVRSIGQFEKLEGLDKEIAVDFATNIFNSEDVNFWLGKGANTVCISPELNITEINFMANKDCEMLGYGHMPLMTTHQCPIGAYDGKKDSSIFCSLKNSKVQYNLKDRKGEEFPLFTDCDQCVCTVLNSKPLFLLKFFEEVLATPTGSIRLMFTIEDAKDTDRIINAYLDCLEKWVNQKPSAIRLSDEMAQKGSTKGHYFRGIE